MNKAYLLIGGNVGDRLLCLEMASKYIEQSAGKVVAKSSIYETEPWGIADQPAFLNQVLLIDTILTVDNLLQTVLSIEENMGRKRMVKFGPRIIDIDILFYNYDIVNKSGLVVPHPEIPNRRFVLAPMNEIASTFIHPVLGKTINRLLEDCHDNLKVERVKF